MSVSLESFSETSNEMNTCNGHRRRLKARLKTAAPLRSKIRRSQIQQQFIILFVEQ
jgi:hypothetical protein